MHSTRTASAALENVKKLNPSKVRNLFPIGKCLCRKISERPYSAYSVACPRCAAGPGYKCVGVRGVLSPIPHFPRERKAAESYRERVRRATDSKNSVKGEGVARGGVRHPLFSFSARDLERDTTPRSNQQSANVCGSVA
jgi:hypothetical protein